MYRSIVTEEGLAAHQREFVRTHSQVPVNVIQRVHQVFIMAWMTFFAMVLILHGMGVMTLLPWQWNIVKFVSTFLVLLSVVLTSVYAAALSLLSGVATLQDLIEPTKAQGKKSRAECVVKFAESFSPTLWKTSLFLLSIARRMLLVAGFVIEGWFFSAFVYGLCMIVFHICFVLNRMFLLKELRLLTVEDIQAYETKDVTPATGEEIDVTPSHEQMFDGVLTAIESSDDGDHLRSRRDE